MITSDTTTRVDLRCGDCRDVLEHLAPNSVDLVYLDPPFNTGRSHHAAAGRYDDSFASTEAYVQFLRERLEVVLRTLHDHAVILVHVDWRTSHHVRLLLDDLLGAEAFVNHLIWRYGLGGSSPRRFARKHDDILFYATGPKYHFDPPLVPATSQRMRGQMKKATDVLDIPSINNMARERVGYPTQKPIALLNLLVSACAPPGGTVLDPFCGSGTTLVAALEHGCHAIGIDRNPDAILIAQDRCHTVLRDAMHTKTQTGRSSR
ncbi:MAG: site-specific DNA-methyltransferase [Planctomycetota bacterium]